MKLSVCSDLHLEFADLDLQNLDNTDVLVLAGDICVAIDLMSVDDRGDQYFAQARSTRYHEFFQRCASRWTNVIYIMGNHEHYHGDYAETLQKLRKCLGYIANLHILERESIVIDDVRFVCGTLWTDMNKEDSDTLYHISKSMNDFRVVKNSKMQGPLEFKPRFHVEDAIQEHKHMRAYIREQASHTLQKVVVVGHHAPSKSSTHPRYESQHLMNGGYSSDLNNLILDHPQIKLWIHGHTHESFDYQIGSTRIVCNPRGYSGHEDSAEGYLPKTVEV